MEHNSIEQQLIEQQSNIEQKPKEKQIKYW